MNVSKTKWVRLGDYIEEVDERNYAGTDYPFCGVNKDKKFMPTVTDTNNLDNRKYKLVKLDTFVFSGMQTGRDICIRIALQGNDETILVSPAYTTFKIKDASEVLPQYLFLQFNRLEMDRLGWFLSDGSIRSNLDWDRFTEIKIPLPPLSVQRELVATYERLKQLAETNEAMMAPLSGACQAFIIDCKRKYPEVTLGEYIEEVDERNYAGEYGIEDVRGMTITKEVIPTKADPVNSDLSKFKVVKPNEFIYNPRTHGKKIGLGFNSTLNPFITSWNNTAFKVSDNLLIPEYLFMLFCRDEWDRNACFRSWGSSTEVFSWVALCESRIPLPPLSVQQSIVNLYHGMEEAKRIAEAARAELRTLCPALVQKSIKG